MTGYVWMYPPLYFSLNLINVYIREYIGSLMGLYCLSIYFYLCLTINKNSLKFSS